MMKIKRNQSMSIMMRSVRCTPRTFWNKAGGIHTWKESLRQLNKGSLVHLETSKTMQMAQRMKWGQELTFMLLCPTHLWGQVVHLTLKVLQSEDLERMNIEQEKRKRPKRWNINGEGANLESLNNLGWLVQGLQELIDKICMLKLKPELPTHLTNANRQKEDRCGLCVRWSSSK